MELKGKEKIVWIIIFSILFIPPVVFSFEFTSFIYPKEIALSILFILLMAFSLMERKISIIPVPLFIFLVMNIFLFLSGLYAKVPQQTLIRSAELFLVFITLFLLTNFIKEKKYNTCVEYGMLLSGIVVAISLVVQYYNILPVLFPPYSFYDQLYSVFGNQNLAGGYIAIIIINFLVYWDRIQIKEIYKFGSLFILGIGLILSNSRSSWFSVMIISILFIIRKYREGEWSKEKYLYFGGMVLLIILLTFPIVYERIRYSFSDMDMGFRVRVWIYDGSIRMFLSNPLLGVGFGNFYYWSPKFLADVLHSSYGQMHFRNEVLTLHAHNDILELITEVGIFGMLFIFLFYFYPLLSYKNLYVWSVFVLISLLNPIFISSSHLIVSFLSLIKSEERVTRKNYYISGFLVVNNKTKYLVCGLGLFTVIFLCSVLWFPDYRLRQAEKLLILGQDCEKQYQSLIDSEFATYAMYEGYAQHLMMKGDYKRAYEVLRKALDKTDGGNVYLMLGQCAEELGEKKECIKWYRECLYRYPDNKYVKERLITIGGLK